MATIIQVFDSPVSLYVGSLLCFVITLACIEGTTRAFRKRSVMLYTSFAILSGLAGISGWLVFFVALLRYTHAGLHP
jgi:uncharacterized membrane protein